MVRRHISDDLKELALSMSLQGLPDSEIHEYTGISTSTLKRLRSTHRRTGHVSSVLPIDSGRPRVLTAIQVKFLLDSVERQPNVALMELQTTLREVCHVEVSCQTVMRSLQRVGYTMKTITRRALEQNEQDREEYMALIAANFRPEQLVFADESHFNRLTLRRPYAWSIRGERACRFEFFFRSSKYSMLPALSLDGILHLEVVENAVTGNDFQQFIQGLLPCMNEWPLPNSVLVIDNATIHKVDGIRELVEGHGARLIYLPTYSPDLNPIELAFSTIKAWLRANRARISADLESDNGSIYNALWEAVHSVTPDDAKGWYSHCGYQPAP